jgi:predicted phosphodiesterase
MDTTNNKQGRRHFLQSLTGAGTALAAAGVLPQSALANAHLLTPADIDKGHVFITKPYLQDPAHNAMVVMWITNMPAYSWVEFGETASLGSKAHSVTNGLVDAYNRINRIRLQGLKPGTKYYYRTCSKEITGFEPYKLTYGDTIQSEVYAFITPQEKADSMSCLIMNDIHDRPASISLLADMHPEKDYDFMFFNGDMFDYQTNEQQIVDHMLLPCVDKFAAEVPFLFVRGNHETRGKYRHDLHHYFYNPGGQQYFSFTRGPVHFTVLDTGEDKPDDTPVYAGIVDFDAYREEQARWAEEVMKSKGFKKARYRVVLMHIPTFYSGDWHGPLHNRKVFAPLFNKYGVDLAISGHTHKYGVHPPVAGEHNYAIVIGGGPKEGTRTLIKLQADAQRLHLSMLDDSKKEVGSYIIKAR